MKIEDIAKSTQTCFENFPTIILGSGASIPHGLPGMPDLSDYLCRNLQTENDAEQDAWNQISEKLTNGVDIEAALDKLDSKLLSKIVACAWQCVNDKDKLVWKSAVCGNKEFALGNLLSRMFESTQRQINIVTTNYDRVAEYACNSKGILFQTGFEPGYIQKWGNQNQLRYSYSSKKARVVKIWKVHGSLDWFRAPNGTIMGLPTFASPPEHHSPLIVTPGRNKYEQTHKSPFRETISSADEVLENSKAFLCVGFGFRDQHIQPKLVEQCREKDRPIVVLAKTLTDKAKGFLKTDAGSSYLGIEECGDGSKVYSNEDPDGIQINKAGLWSLNGFNELVT